VSPRQLASLLAALFFLGATVIPPGEDGDGLIATPELLVPLIVAAGAIGLAAWNERRVIPLAAVSATLGCGLALKLLHAREVNGHAGMGFWLIVLGSWIAATQLVAGLSALTPRGKAARRLLGALVPLAFGAFLFFLWEVLVRGFGVPPVLMPAPSAIAARFAASLPTMREDFVQTFLRGVLTGYLIGCTAGFLVAVVADRVPFLQRGLLPLGNFVAALPIVGIAPIMVMWFGFDWPSKAAVVVVMTFFPMLVNTVAGLAASGSIERDLMRSYGASYWQSLLKLRLPAAMPFIFNALKINSTLALIGAIVAEFFGTPIVGMGFRISIEVARLSLDMVWAEIALAAISGTIFYGVVALAERATTFWHPSYRA
jgi:NitT/TauT family transport system permease protein